MIARILSIAGSDSGGGAGIQADVKTITMLGGHAMTAITAITVQNTLGVTAIVPVPEETIGAQIDAVTKDIGVDAIKIGMVPDLAAAYRIGAALIGAPPTVFDPVMVASSGAMLVDAGAIDAFVGIIRMSTLVTPNAIELVRLAGGSIFDDESLAAAARRLFGLFGTPVLAKGGHIAGGGGSDMLTDILFDGYQERRWSAPRIETRHSHGTGCTLSAAIATGLGQGMSLPDAIDRARRYVRAALTAAPGLGAGHGPMGHGLGRTHFT